MEGTSECETPVTVNVRALANFFQSLSRENTAKTSDCVISSSSWPRRPASQSHSRSVPDQQVGLSPDTCSLRPTWSPREDTTDIKCQQENEPQADVEVRQDERREQKQPFAPVPLPRISLIRRQTAYGSSAQHSDQSIYCDILNTSHQDDCSSDHATDHVSDEDIYEEIPDSYSSSQPDLQCATRHENISMRISPINRKLSHSLQKIKVVFQRSPGDDSKRKVSLFQFKGRDTKDRKLPKPPSVEQLERPFRSPSQFIYQNKVNEITEPNADCYYDVQEVESCTGSDDYYICIDNEESEDAEAEEEDAYEIIDPVSPEVSTSTPSACDGSVQYAEIDPVKTRELEKRIEKEQKRFERRQKEQAEKWRKKFKLTGQEVPVNYGTVKADVGRSRANRLRVKKGETVLVLRMQGNPPGLYLAKNERSEVGYIELRNIEFDPESIKAIMLVDPEMDTS